MMTTLQTKSFRIGHFLAMLLLLAAAPLHLSAQSPSSPAAPLPLRFEVASIRPHPFTGDEPSNRRILPGGRFVATATTVRTLIRIASGLDDNRMSGAPGWINNETFDINATIADHAEVRTPEQFQQLILSLLEDRFQFKFHREQKEGPVYWLKLNKPGKTGPALKPSTPDSQPNMSTNFNGAMGEMKASKMSMADVAAALRRQAGRPVEDHTGLKGNFDFEIKWSPEEIPDSVYPSLFTVLKEQLGLKLQPAKGTVETLVIDQIAHPSAN
ncbi:MULTISPECIES: TIGR03435 family protein [Acidobacteriaceae]|uniref:TIGR03435 family protein n=1 Tax=Acidobacteriaceae TaxID=204434 RepID=UPI0020B14E5B|nr:MULTISPECIES: TIGR03435 family protein [Acidobacteriaceae]MDW5267738.1 TIGR03435 family protein [Edaphobacter sp.]